MSSPNNQNTLFRFVSLRSPELSDKENLERRFVFHPNDKKKLEQITAGSSYFFDALKNNVSLSTAAASYQGFKNADEINSRLEAVQSGYSDKTVWLARNKANSKPINYATTLSAVTQLPSDLVAKLWDEIFYQALTDKSFYVKEAAMHALILDYAVTWIKKENSEGLNKLVYNATVVLPTNLFGQSKSDTAINSTRPVNNDNSYTSKKTANVVKRQGAQSNILNFESTLREVKELETKFNILNDKIIGEERKLYDANVQSLMDQYNTDYFAAKRALCSTPPLTGYDRDDFCNEPDVAIPVIAPFTHEYRLQDEIDYLTVNLSGTSKYTLSTITDITTTTFEIAKQVLENALKKENETVLKNTEFSRKMTTIGDVTIPIAHHLSRTAIMGFVVCPKPVTETKIAPRLTIDMRSSALEVLSVSYELTRYNNTIVSGTSSLSSAVYADTHVTINDMGVFDSVDNNGIAVYTLFKGEVKFSDNTVKAFQVTNLGQEIQVTDPDTGQQITTKCQEGKMTEKAGTPVPDVAGGFIPLGFGFRQLGIADYRKVVQEVCCYDAGEVAHIDIMAKEFKEKTTVKETIRETTVFESEETEKETLSDNVSTQRFEMQTEIAKILQQQQQIEAHAQVHSTMGLTTTLDAGGSYANNTTKEQSNSQAVTQAQEITERATERILSRIKKETTVKITESFKDTNSHIFDNRDGDTHVSCVYRFVNAIYKNQIYNYGKRLMYEFIVPEPSKLHFLGQQSVEADKNNLVEPIDPRTVGFPDFTYIQRGNYQHLAAQYGANVDISPAQTLVVSQTFDYSGPSNATASKTGAVRITDERYVPTFATLRFNGTPYPYYPSVKIIIGESTTTFINVQGGNRDAILIDGYKGEVPVAISIMNYLTLTVSVTVRCLLSSDGYAQWQKETFEAILAGYNRQREIYDQAMQERKANGVQMLDSNPLFYRQIEQLTLRKNCISYLIDNTASSPQRFGQDMYNTPPQTFDNLEVVLTKGMDDYCSLAKFMEQAFEWNLISYNFYPYYWGSKSDWTKLYQFDSNDAIFRSFMQAGMARVVVSVKPGFEDAVMHYMAFGKIWNGGVMPVLGDPLYLSIVDELKEPEYAIEKTWETVLPTNLVVLQNSGVGLIAPGLPCGDDCKDALANNPFSNNSSKLAAKADSPTA